MAAGIGLAALLTAAPASAAVTLGSALETEPTGPTACGNPQTDRGCFEVQDVLPGRELVAPFDGVIVRWRVRLGNATNAQTIRIRVVRRVDADTFTAISSGGLENVPDGAGTYAFPAQLPIASGDQLGIEQAEGITIEWEAATPGARRFLFNPSPADGADTGIASVGDDVEVTFNADVEPDCDADGLGDESQDPNVFGGSCAPRSRSLTLETSRPRVRKGKKVRFFGVLDSPDNEQACESNQAIELQRKKPHQDDFSQFEQLQTDAAGDFSTKEKVKKTFEYRAQAGETAACNGQVSDIEKVKVKKKK